MYLLVAIQAGNNEYAAATDTLDVCAISDNEGLMYIDGIYYKYTDDGSALKVVRGYNPYRGKVEIPATVNGLPVTEVDGLAMYACYYLKELVIGDKVKKCGHEAFGASINLCNVTLPVADVEFTHNWMFNCDRGIREIHCRSSFLMLSMKAFLMVLLITTSVFSMFLLALSNLMLILRYGNTLLTLWRKMFLRIFLI